ncbi:hypothetical protein SSPO_000520 [Streptomyces antimycoticus]|uniref:Aminoglycoside phosphotransferase domain-containing protein n=1 Tax=Streptomyces antimycoticus TaxID=68175 RepID=A0A499U9N8_9ACTN|nr:hypothetical protein SSPO_000520 [Streptomyces antimycoticus]
MWVTTLECAREFSSGPNDENASRVYVQETHGDPPLEVPGGRWVAAEELSQTELAEPAHREVMQAWFAEAAHEEVPVRRLPWARAKWFSQASEWSVEQLAELGRAVTGPVEQLDSRLWSALLRIPTSAGDVYFKAVPSVFGHEPALTQALDHWFPGSVPHVIAIDADRHWMLTDDFGKSDESVDGQQLVESYLRIVPYYAQMQVKAVDRVAVLLALGCPRRPTSQLPDRLEELLEDVSLLYLGEENGLTSEEHGELRRFLPRFREICAKLDEFAIPETLMHSDAWRGNFILDGPGKGAGPLIFDWAESAVSHPFYSLTIMLKDIRESVSGAERAISQVAEAYLAEWTDYAAPGQLVTALKLSTTPGIVNRTVEWRNGIAELEPERALFYRYAIPVNLRRLIPWTH